MLVDRYVNLLRAGVDPDNILAITFTRKAAAEMRAAHRRAAAGSEPARRSSTPARWRDLRDRLSDIAISTIDAFCLSLLREFPLEADVDPGFALADDTEVPRLIDEALDRALRICRAHAREDDDVALVFAQLGERRLRAGLARCSTAGSSRPTCCGAILQTAARSDGGARLPRRTASAARDLLSSVPGGLERFLNDGPFSRPAFAMLAADIRTCAASGSPQATRSRTRLIAVRRDGRRRPRLAC